MKSFNSLTWSFFAANMHLSRTEFSSQWKPRGKMHRIKSSTEWTMAPSVTGSTVTFGPDCWSTPFPKSINVCLNWASVGCCKRIFFTEWQQPCTQPQAWSFDRRHCLGLRCARDYCQDLAKTAWEYHGDPPKGFCRSADILQWTINSFQGERMKHGGFIPQDQPRFPD